MSSVPQNRDIAIPGLGLSATRRAVLGPVLVVVMVLGLLVGARMSAYHGSPAGFVLFGQRYVAYTHPPAGAPLESPIGYDGQFYWLEARDPLLLHRSTFTNMGGPGAGYHFQRPAYPALAFLLAFGQLAALPWTLLLVNLLAVIGVTAAFAAYCHRRGWSPWWALVIGLMPGLLMPTLRDLTDTLALATAVTGLLAWYSGRRWWAAGCLSVAILSREPMIFIPIAVALEAGMRCWRARHERRMVRRQIWVSWPPILVPALAYTGWQIYIHLQAPAIAAGARVGSTAPPALSALNGLISRLHELFAAATPLVAGWEITHLALVVAAGVTALLLLPRFNAAGIAALLFAALLLVIQAGDQWALTRYTAPVFAMLMVAGLEQNSRTAKAICVAATGMSLFLPWLIVGL